MRIVSTLVLVVLLVGTGTPALACKYCVRDVAFVDLGDSGYTLQLFAAEAPSLDIQPRRTLRDACAAYLTDTVVTVELPTEKPAWATDSISVRLVRGDDALTLPLYFGAQSAQSDDASAWSDRAWDRIESVITSPARRRALAVALDVHSVVFLLEGNDPETNARAHRIVTESKTAIDKTLSTLPKPMENGPHVVTVSFAERSAERVLMWSLGIEVTDADAVIAPVMGRLRRLGDPLVVPGAARDDLVERLALVGLDCECGLDRKWMQGAMVPHDWTTDTEAAAVAALGFDPGNPLVKAEISRILARGGDGERHGDGDQSDSTGRSVADVGYREVTVGESQPDVASRPKAATAPTAEIASTATPFAHPPRSSVSLGLWIAVAVLGSVVLIGVVTIFSRNGRGS